MSRTATPTDNPIIEALNGELNRGFVIEGICKSVVVKVVNVVRDSFADILCIPEIKLKKKRFFHPSDTTDYVAEEARAELLGERCTGAHWLAFYRVYFRLTSAPVGDGLHQVFHCIVSLACPSAAFPPQGNFV